MEKDYLNISDLNNYIKNILDKDSFLNKVYLKGEISNFKNHTRGHLYFTLKDDNSRISAVMFQSSAIKLTFVPEDGYTLSKVIITNPETNSDEILTSTDFVSVGTHKGIIIDNVQHDYRIKVQFTKS